MEMNYLNWEEATKKICTDVDFYFDEGYLAGLNRTVNATWLQDGITSMVITLVDPSTSIDPIRLSAEQAKEILKDSNGVLSQEYIQGLIESVYPSVVYTNYAINMHGSWKLSEINFNFNKWFCEYKYTSSDPEYMLFSARVDYASPRFDTSYAWYSDESRSDTKININSWSKFTQLQSARLNKTTCTEILIYGTKSKHNTGDVDSQVRTNTLTANAFSNFLFNVNAPDVFTDQTVELLRRLLSKGVLSDALFSLDDEKAIKTRWSQIFNTIRSTQDEYSKLIELQEANIDKINDAIKTASNNVVKFKDTPQIGAAYGGDGYNTTVTVNETETTVAMSLADKLDIAYKFLNDIYDKWLAVFSKYFLY